MGTEGRGGKHSPFRTDTVRGEPYQVSGRTLVPEARILAVGKARGTIGSRVMGWGGGLVQITPVAVVEQTVDGEQRIAIRDGTAAAMGGLLAVTVAITLLLAIVRWSACRLHSVRAAPGLLNRN